jgi:hypothetical protein
MSRSASRPIDSPHQLANAGPLVRFRSAGHKIHAHSRRLGHGDGRDCPHAPFALTSWYARSARAPKLPTRADCLRAPSAHGQPRCGWRSPSREPSAARDSAPEDFDTAAP